MLCACWGKFYLGSRFAHVFYIFTQPKATWAGDEKHRKKKAHGLSVRKRVLVKQHWATLAWLFIGFLSVYISPFEFFCFQQKTVTCSWGFLFSIIIYNFLKSLCLESLLKEKAPQKSPMHVELTSPTAPYRFSICCNVRRQKSHGHFHSHMQYHHYTQTPFWVILQYFCPAFLCLVLSKSLLKKAKSMIHADSCQHVFLRIRWKISTTDVLTYRMKAKKTKEQGKLIANQEPKLKSEKRFHYQPMWPNLRHLQLNN